MYTQQENEPEFEEQHDDQEEGVEIYSNWAILGFSIFFDVLFGAALLMINLFNVGLRGAAWRVLLFAIAYTFFSGAAATFLAAAGVPFFVVALSLKVLGGLMLSNYFFKKYFPDDDYYPRSIWPALAVSLLIMFALAYIAAPYLAPMMKQLKQA